MAIGPRILAAWCARPAGIWPFGQGFSPLCSFQIVERVALNEVTWRSRDGGSLREVRPAGRDLADRLGTGTSGYKFCSVHHVHLYAPRSINPDSNMPSYRFLYRKRRITGERSAEALQLSGSDAPAAGWEIVPTFDAKCVVAYLMGLNQSHPLKEVRSVGGAPATGGASAPAAPVASPAPAAGGSPAAPK